MVGLISESLAEISAGIVSAIVATLIINFFKYKIYSQILKFTWWVTNKDIEFFDFRLSIVYEYGFNDDELQGLGKMLSDKKFECKFFTPYNFVLTKSFSYEVNINKTHEESVESFETPLYSMEIVPNIKTFSYRSGIEMLAKEMSLIVESLSGLGKGPTCYLNVRIKGAAGRYAAPLKS